MESWPHSGNFTDSTNDRLNPRLFPKRTLAYQFPHPLSTASAFLPLHCITSCRSSHSTPSRISPFTSPVGQLGHGSLILDPARRTMIDDSLLSTLKSRSWLTHRLAWSWLFRYPGIVEGLMLLNSYPIVAKETRLSQSAIFLRLLFILILAPFSHSRRSAPAALFSIQSIQSVHGSKYAVLNKYTQTKCFSCFWHWKRSFSSENVRKNAFRRNL